MILVPEYFTNTVFWFQSVDVAAEGMAQQFDVTLLMPQRYGGVSEVHRPSNGFVSGDDGEDRLSVGGGDHGDSGRRGSFFGDIEDNGEDDFIGGSGVPSDDAENGQLLGSSRMFSSEIPNGATQHEQKDGSGSGGVMDFLNQKLIKGRSHSRLSTVIQVKPYEQSDKSKKEADAQDQSEDDTDQVEQQISNSDDNSVYNMRYSPNVKVSRSKSFNYSYLSSSPATPMRYKPPHSSLATHHPQPYLSPTSPTPSHFIPKKLASNGFYPSQSHPRSEAGSRVTL